jgi:type IV secretory pathway VirB6-like protein
MVTYYSTPIPGMGYSFSDLVIQEASSLSNSIGIEQGRLVETKVTEVEQGLEQPSSVNLHEILTFVVLYVILAAVQAVIFMVIGFGLIAQAVLLLVGPIFIPFFVVPKMDWLFWGWFKAFLQYSFYQVVANAFVFIFAKLLLAFFAIDTGGMTVEQWMTAFPAMFIFLLIAIYGLLKIPALTNHLFSGAAGADSGLAAAMVAYVSRG